MGSLILVTLLLFHGTGEPVRVMKFIIPHAMEMNDVDQTIMNAIKDGKPFAFQGSMAKVEKINHMEDRVTIGHEIKLIEAKP